MTSKFIPKTRPAGLVTIDVEPDNVWRETHSRSLENLRCLPLFHGLCKEYAVRPTYLVSWSVASDDTCASIIETLLSYGDCEVGIHPHLWETPPIVDQDAVDCAWVGPDYTTEVLEAKLVSLTNLIKQRFGPPASHRAGRWGMDTRQVDILTSLGVRVDSSVTPGINWSVTGAPDYTAAPLRPYLMGTEDVCKLGSSNILQIPCTIKPGLQLWGAEKMRYAAGILRRMGLGYRWLRPSPSTSVNGLLQVCSWAYTRLPQQNLMSHSSEFMVGGSPYWSTSVDLDKQFQMYRRIFEWWQDHGVEPKTLSEFAANYFAPVSERTP